VRALLLIDIQNDYFPSGRFTLQGAPDAAERAAELLTRFRGSGLPVLHVRHADADPAAPFLGAGTPGAHIHPPLSPRVTEAVIVKAEPNAFHDTGLDERLRGLGVSELVVAGMMSNMCVDATVRAALDLGYRVTLVAEACAASEVRFEGAVVPASQVHAAFMGALADAGAELSTAGAAGLIP
jgi:nicotinamidase-related amidase